MRWSWVHLRRRAVFVCVLTAWIIAGCAARSGQAAAASTPEAMLAQSGLPTVTANRPELSRPIADQKRVIAHFMTGMVPAKEGETKAWMNPALYDPHGPTAAIGGEFQTIPDSVLVHPNLLPLKQAALLEMRTAKKLGIDGFDFYYPFGPNESFRDGYDRIILAFFATAQKHHLDFKLTLCFCAADGVKLTTKQKIKIWGVHLKKLINATRDNDHWLKTPDGRVLFYTWIADGMMDEYLAGKQWEIRKHPALLEGIASAFNQVAHDAGVRAAFMYHLQFPEDAGFVNKALDYFPAVTGWCNVDQLDVWRNVAKLCKARHRTYVQEVHPDYYTSKVFPRGGYDLIFDVNKVLKLGVQGIERHAQVLGLTKNYRDQLQLAVDLDTPLINFTTWNDYPEGHHLSPEINHNFGFSILLRYYEALWRGKLKDSEKALPPTTLTLSQGKSGSELAAPSDVAVVFFKKYPANVKPEPYDIPVRYVKKLGPPTMDDGIEVVTILSAPGRLKINDLSPRNVGAGLTVTRVPMTPGPVRVTVTRDGKVVAKLTTPEWITLTPFRTDRLTYSFSSQFKAIYRSIYGNDVPLHTAMEYAQNAAGVPQWKRGMRTTLAMP